MLRNFLALVRMPITKTKMATTFIKKTGVNVWNSLPNDITHDMKIGAFKRLIITHLNSKYSAELP